MIDVEIDRFDHVAGQQPERSLRNEGLDVPAVGGRKVIEADDPFADLEQPLAQMRTEEASTPSDQDFFIGRFPLTILRLDVDSSASGVPPSLMSHGGSSCKYQCRTFLQHYAKETSHTYQCICEEIYVYINVHHWYLTKVDTGELVINTV